jgi:peptide-methionine (S)-S-oxide reductase
MPTKRLPASASLDHLKSQARDFLTDFVAGDAAAVQRLSEFHPQFSSALNDNHTALTWSDALLVTAREYGYASWARLKRAVEAPQNTSQPSLIERIADPTLRTAVEAIDDGDIDTLSRLFDQDAKLGARRALFEGENYFREPALLAFIAENPVRNDALPPNILDVARLLLVRGAGEKQADLDETLGLVASGRVARECGVQRRLISLLCSHGANAEAAMLPALGQGEFDAVEALLVHGAKATLPVLACIGGAPQSFSESLLASTPHERHLALALAAMHGKSEIVRTLLEFGESPNRYNPVGMHAHATPMHTAAWNGDVATLKCLVTHGARKDMRDTLWRATPREWAEHAGQNAAVAYLAEPS